jgi:hypothetical protein
MKKSIKAALFSALLFPGTGHFSLQKMLRGLIFFIPSFLSVIYIVHYSLDKAYAIADQLNLGNIPLDTNTITNLIAEPPTGETLLKLQIATWTIIVCWIVSIIDSFLLGKKADQVDPH